MWYGKDGKYTKSKKTGKLEKVTETKTEYSLPINGADAIMLKDAKRIIAWANQNITGPSALNDEMDAWLNMFDKVYQK